MLKDLEFFASPYGSWNPMDEFAENETYVILGDQFSRTVALEVFQNGQLVKR